jgi:hypothetical protein
MNSSNPSSYKFKEFQQLSTECWIKFKAITLAFKHLNEETKPLKSSEYLDSQEIDKRTKIAQIEHKIDNLKGKF